MQRAQYAFRLLVEVGYDNGNRRAAIVALQVVPKQRLLGSGGAALAEPAGNTSVAHSGLRPSIEVGQQVHFLNVVTL